MSKLIIAIVIILLLLGINWYSENTNRINNSKYTCENGNVVDGVLFDDGTTIPINPHDCPEINPFDNIVGIPNSISLSNVSSKSIPYDTSGRAEYQITNLNKNGIFNMEVSVDKVGVDFSYYFKKPNDNTEYYGGIVGDFPSGKSRTLILQAQPNARPGVYESKMIVIVSYQSDNRLTKKFKTIPIKVVVV